MYLEQKDTIEAPLEETYQLVRDDLSKVATYLPNIKEISTLSREQTGATHRVVNHWVADAEMPGLMSKFVSQDLFSWKDYATWNDDEYSVQYELESFLANDLFSAKGVNSFKKVGDNQTEITVSCEVEIYPEKIPGIPRLLTRKVTPLVESLIQKMIQPNLTSLGSGLRAYFAEHDS